MCFIFASWCSLLLQFIFLTWAFSQITEPILMAIKKELLGDNPLYFCFLLFFFLLSLGSYYLCNNRSLSCFVPRVASNWKKVRFEDLLSWKQILCYHEINSCSQLERHFELKFFEHMPQVIIWLSLVSHFSIWAT